MMQRKAYLSDSVNLPTEEHIQHTFSRGKDNDGEYGSFDGSQKEQHDQEPKPEPDEMPAQEWGLHE